MVTGVLLAAVLQGCSSLDALVFGPEPEADPRGVGMAPVGEDTPFPPVASVPRRPQLSYTLQQERDIVDSLVGDRENARYTASLVRYRAGRADVPPAGAPSAGAPSTGKRGATVVGPPGEADPATGGLLEDPPEELAQVDREREFGQTDDGGIDDFVRDLVDETKANPDLDTQTALIDRRGGEEKRVPGQKGRESAFQRLFYWLTGSEDEGSDEAPPADDAPAVAPGTAAGGAGGPRSGSWTIADAIGNGQAGGGDTDASAASGGGRTGVASQLPRLKPEEGADPPRPAPAKPLGGGDGESGPQEATAARQAS